MAKNALFPNVYSYIFSELNDRSSLSVISKHAYETEDDYYNVIT